MSTASGGSPRQTRSLGVFEGALLRPFVKLVTVRAARPCGERFRLVVRRAWGAEPRAALTVGEPVAWKVA